MKLKKDVCFRKIGDEYILVPNGKTVEQYNGLFSMSESGAVLFEAICDGKEDGELVKALTDEFDIDEETAKKDTEAFLKMLDEFGIVQLE